MPKWVYLCVGYVGIAFQVPVGIEQARIADQPQFENTAALLAAGKRLHQLMAPAREFDNAGKRAADWIWEIHRASKADRARCRKAISSVKATVSKRG